MFALIYTWKDGDALMSEILTVNQSKLLLSEYLIRIVARELGIKNKDIEGFAKNLRISEPLIPCEDKPIKLFYQDYLYMLVFCDDRQTPQTYKIEEVMDPGEVLWFNNAYEFLSNFYESCFEFNGITYRNAESAFQAQKCVNPEQRKDFVDLTGAKAKELGHKVELRPDWELVKYRIMYEVLKAKFSVSRLKKLLLATGNMPLVESNDWHDNEYGDCCCSWHRCKDIPGRNMLGNILMKVRRDIISKKG